jgi:hypothetical protein
MRILARDGAEIVLRDVTVYLTPGEADDMLGQLADLRAAPARLHHVHIADAEFEHEVTLTIYSEETFDQFDERSKRLIREGR